MLSRLTPLAVSLALAACSSPAPEGRAAAPEARSREQEALEYEPVTLNGFSCGDNCYLELTRAVEGAAPETILCTAPECADWQTDGALPAELRDTRALVKFGTADQVDGSGTAVNQGVGAAVGLRLPAGFGRTAAQASSGGTDPLPLTRGVYVAEGSDCAQPANAAVRIWTGSGLSGSATRDCRPTIRSRDGRTYRVSNSCENTYDGSRTSASQTITVPDPTRFTLTEGGEARVQRFRLCPMNEVPASLRKLAR